MNKLFAIADLHLSFSCDKPMDIFPGWEDHASRIETNWRKVVGENDTVVVPGDISWAMTTEEARPDLDFINKLPGRKIIGRGNHDYWWTTLKKMREFLASGNVGNIEFQAQKRIREEEKEARKNEILYQRKKREEIILSYGKDIRNISIGLMIIAILISVILFGKLDGTIDKAMGVVSGLVHVVISLAVIVLINKNVYIENIG